MLTFRRGPAAARRRGSGGRRGARRVATSSTWSSPATLTRRSPRSLELSVKSVRRATEQAIAERRLDGGAHYVHLQVLRLTKAMRVVDLNLDEGDLKAVGPMLKIIAQLDKYHALNLPAPATPPAPPRLAAARPPLALAAPEAVEVGTETAPKRLKSPDAGHEFALRDLAAADGRRLRPPASRRSPKSRVGQDRGAPPTRLTLFRAKLGPACAGPLAERGSQSRRAPAQHDEVDVVEKSRDR